MIDLKKLEKLAEEIKEAEKNEPIKKLIIDKDYYDKLIYPSKKEVIEKINKIIEFLNQEYNNRQRS